MLEPWTQEVPRGLVSRRQHEPMPSNRLDTSKLGPVKIDPSRPTMLEAEIKAVLVSRPNPDEAARRILKIDHIRRALDLLDSIENPRQTPHSSDAR